MVPKYLMIRAPPLLIDFNNFPPLGYLHSFDEELTYNLTKPIASNSLNYWGYPQPAFKINYNRKKPNLL